MSKENAFALFREISGLEVFNEEEANEKYQRNTLGISRIILGALRPKTVEQIQKIVNISDENGIKLFTFSSGHNWGFGSSLPTVDNCVIVDLSRMKEIIEFNEKLGYVTLEPGVTQQDLYDYIVKNNLDFMVPTTGAGPSCSIIGNALERGYGLTPNIDHFAAVINLEAVLPNGEIYRSSFDTFGANKSDNIYKWKVGPYLDGIFSQSNFGIVTKATIEILHRPEHVGQFIAFIDEKNFKDVVAKVAIVKERFGTMIGGINLMNTHRLLSMVEKKGEWKVNGILPQEQIKKLAKKRSIPDWAVLIGVYSPDELISPIKKALRSAFGPYAKHQIFLTHNRLSFVEKILRFFPGSGLNRTAKTIDLALQILSGIPNEVALPLAYLKNPHPLPEKNRHPDYDGCGLLWYCPLVPVEGPITEKFCHGIKEIMISEEIEPMITLTTISQRCFASNIPLVFNRDDKKQCEQVFRCFNRMLDFAMELGLFPDRLDIETIRKLYDSTDSPGFDLTQKIKDALDPNHTFAPGRYMKLTDKDR